MYEQYLVRVRQKFSGDNWYNAIVWMPDRKAGQRYVGTEEKAKAVLANALELWNGEKQYDENGKRYETQTVGAIGITCESTKETDNDLMITEYQILRRTVTEWEEV